MMCCRNFYEMLQKRRIESKLVYVLTVSGIVFLSYSVFVAPWCVPYFYSVVTPVLLLYRLVQYWRLKYQYFLLDFCYFGNAFIYTYIWAFPDNEKMFTVSFAIATGPLLFSMLAFRNSLVFHSVDKITSAYIHAIPPILLHVIRWYPEETARYWPYHFYTSGVNFNSEWLIFIPFSFPVLHQILYGVFVYAIMRPSDEYLYTYNYFVDDKERSKSYKISHCLGHRLRYVVFGVCWLLIIFVMLIFNILWYNYFVANCVALGVCFTWTTFNGATYYVDVFSRSGVATATAATTTSGSPKDRAQSDASSIKSRCQHCDHVESNSVNFLDTVLTIQPPDDNGSVARPV